MKKLVKLFSTLLLVLSLLVSVLALTSCSQGIVDSTPDGIKKYGKLVVAMNAYFPPFEYVGDDGEITGWDVDIAKALAEKLGVELEIVNIEFDSVLVAPNTNKAHISMSGISYSEKRDESLDFTNGVFDSSQVIIVKEGSTITGPFDLGGAIVGVQAATVGQYLAEMDPSWAGEGESACLAAPKSVSKYTMAAEAITALVQGKVDAVILDKFPAQTFVAKNEGLKILDEVVFNDEYAFAVAEGNKELVDWLNTALDEMRKDGTMDKINNKYFG